MNLTDLLQSFLLPKGNYYYSSTELILTPQSHAIEVLKKINCTDLHRPLPPFCFGFSFKKLCKGMCSEVPNDLKKIKPIQSISQ